MKKYSIFELAPSCVGHQAVPIVQSNPFSLSMTSHVDEQTTTTSDDRIMNDTTMPPPSSASFSASAVANRSNQQTRKMEPPPPRRKKEGRFGLAAWNRLVASSKDLAQRHGRPLRNDITWDEIRQHNTVHDGWIVLKGKVYFISPYLAYHPGGESILKPVLGKDATQLYYKYHMWVNEDGSVNHSVRPYVHPTTGTGFQFGIFHSMFHVSLICIVFSFFRLSLWTV
jgi:hypothetical protein